MGLSAMSKVQRLLEGSLKAQCSLGAWCPLIIPVPPHTHKHELIFRSLDCVLRKGDEPVYTE